MMLTAGERVVLACFLFTLGLLTLIFSGFTAHAAERVSIRLVNGPIIRAGDELIIYCRVPLDPKNAGLRAGVGDTSSDRELDGVHDAVTNRFTFRPNTCGETVAYCALAEGDGKIAGLAKSRVQVTGTFCD